MGEPPREPERQHRAAVARPSLRPATTSVPRRLRAAAPRGPSGLRLRVPRPTLAGGPCDRSPGLVTDPRVATRAAPAGRARTARQPRPHAGAASALPPKGSIATVWHRSSTCTAETRPTTHSATATCLHVPAAIHGDRVRGRVTSRVPPNAGSCLSCRPPGHTWMSRHERCWYPERTPGPLARRTSRMTTAFHGVWCPSTFAESVSDSYRGCLPRLCCASRFSQPLDALFRPTLFGLVSCR